MGGRGAVVIVMLAQDVSIHRHHAAAAGVSLRSELGMKERGAENDEERGERACRSFLAREGPGGWESATATRLRCAATCLPKMLRTWLLFSTLLGRQKSE